MKKSTRNIVIGVGILAVVLAIFLMTRPATTTKQTYITEEVRKGNIEMVVSATGKVVALKSQNISARVSAKVVNVLVSTGDDVEEGSVLAYLDRTDLESAYKNAQYAFNAAVYRRDQLKNAPLYDDYAVKQAQQQVNQAQLSVESAKRNLENDKLIAPFKGQVTAVNIKVGDTTSPTASAFSMQTIGQVEGTLSVNEVDIVKIKRDQEVVAEIDAVGGTRDAVIYSIVNNADVINGVVTYLAKIRFDDITDLRPGMTLNGDVIVEKKENVVIVPSGALTQVNGVTKVKVIVGKNAQGNDLLEEREVKIGLNNNSEAEVLEGLAAGDKVAIVLESDDSSSSSLFSR